MERGHSHGETWRGVHRRTLAWARASLVVIHVLAGAWAPARAAAEYLCQPLDVPGSEWTQVWQLNNAGALVAGSSLGAFVYSGGAWLQLPAPPAESGYTSADLGALGINDSGVVAGGAFSPGTLVLEGFVLTGTTYEFFRFDPARFPGSTARAISNAGIVTGAADVPGAGLVTAFVYNRGAAGPYAQGFTEIAPTLDGNPSFQTIPGAMNDAFQFVGSAFFPGGQVAFLYDPSLADPIAFFRVFAGLNAAARGLNNRGDIVGFTRTDSGRTAGFRGSLVGGQLAVELIACAALEGLVDAFAQSVNDDGVVTGSWVDTAGNFHGFIAYPSPALPQAIVNGVFVFDLPVSPDTPVFLDPEVAIGYQYAIGVGDPLFTSVTLPIGIGDDLFTVLVEGRAFELPAGQELDFEQNGFPGGVAAFEVVGIEPSANLDPASPTAFVTEVTFGAAGRFTGSMRPMTVEDVLADLLEAVEGAGPGKSLAAKVRTARDALGAANARASCAALAAFRSESAAQAGKKIPPTLARALTAEAAAIMSALGCP